MRKTFKAAFVLLWISAVSALVANAGWEHQRGGKTTWIERPSPATCWARDINNDLVLLRKAFIYHDTLRWYTFGEPASNSIVNMGFWEVDANGDFSTHSDVAAIYANTGRLVNFNMAWDDVEWLIDVNGDLVAKE